VQRPARSPAPPPQVRSAAARHAGTAHGRAFGTEIARRPGTARPAGSELSRSGHTPVGLIAERDIVREVDRNAGGIRDLTVGSVMHTPAPTRVPDERLDALRARMTRDRLRHRVVVEGGRIVGVPSVGDLVKQRLDECRARRVLRDFVVAQRASR
jgi:hypothetical protein